MGFDDRIPDKTLLQQVKKKLTQAGVGTTVTATVTSGYLTLTGVLDYATQRRVVVRKAQQVPGIRQLTDQMTVKVRKRVDS